MLHGRGFDSPKWLTCPVWSILVRRRESGDGLIGFRFTEQTGGEIGCGDTETERECCPESDGMYWAHEPLDFWRSRLAG